jgi:hypothetical protein
LDCRSRRIFLLLPVAVAEDQTTHRQTVVVAVLAAIEN